MSVKQYFECSDCGEYFMKEHDVVVLWITCPKCGGRAFRLA